MMTFHLAQDREQSMHMKRLEENVDVRGSDLPSPFANLGIERITKNGNLVRPFGFREFNQRLEHFPVGRV